MQVREDRPAQPELCTPGRERKLGTAQREIFSATECESRERSASATRDFLCYAMVRTWRWEAREVGRKLRNCGAHHSLRPPRGISARDANLDLGRGAQIRAPFAATHIPMTDGCAHWVRAESLREPCERGAQPGDSCRKSARVLEAMLHPRRPCLLSSRVCTGHLSVAILSDTRVVLKICFWCSASTLSLGRIAMSVHYSIKDATRSNTLRRPKARHVPRPLELLDDSPVPANDHLVQEEIEPVTAHLPEHRVVVSKPDVGLFRDGRVEKPAVRRLQFLEVGRVAVLLAEDIGIFMLTIEVERVDRQADVVEECVSIGVRVALEQTVVVEEDVVWSEVRVTVCPPNKLLV